MSGVRFGVEHMNFWRLNCAFKQRGKQHLNVWKRALLRNDDHSAARAEIRLRAVALRLAAARTTQRTRCLAELHTLQPPLVLREPRKA